MLPDSLARLDSCWFLYYKVSFERFSLQFIQAPSFFEIHSLVNLIGPIYSKWVVYIQVDVDSAAQLSSFEWFLCLLDSLDFFLWAYWLNSSIWSGFFYCVLTLSLAWCEGSSFFLLFLHRLSNAIFTVLSLYRPSMTYQYCFKCHVIEVAIYAWLWSWMEWLRCTVFLITAYWVVMLVNVEMAP